MRLALIVALAAGACCAPARTAADFAADPKAARAAVAACEAGRRTRDCEAARAGLIEARRRARMNVYRQAF